MSNQFILINQTKKQQISFAHLNGSKKRELAGNSAQSAIVTWYMLNNIGDNIQFVTDSESDWPFVEGNKQDSYEYEDKTEDTLAQLIDAGVLKDKGYLYVDDDDPENVYIKDIVNIWY